MATRESSFLSSIAAALAISAILLTGCRDSGHHGHSGHGHHHTPPHGGTPVVLGNEEYHLELVLDATNATLRAYVLDGHMENFIRVTNATFNVIARQGEASEALEFHAVPNAATGETLGDTSLFEAKAPCLTTATNFDATIEILTIRGKRFEKVNFNFPRGNKTSTETGR